MLFEKEGRNIKGTVVIPESPRSIGVAVA